MTESAAEALVDAHLHLWDPQRIRMSWLGGMPALDRAFLVSDLQEDLGPLAGRLEAAVLVEPAVDAESLDDELEWFASQLSESGLIRAAVAGWQPRAGTADVLRRLDALSDLPGVVGVRHVLHPPEITAASVLEHDHVQAVRLAGERGFLVELCVRPDQLQAATDLIDLAPGTRFVLDHLGRPRTGEDLDPRWVDSLAALADRESLVTKMSALIECAQDSDADPEGFEPFVNTALDLFGADRVLWGSNWPVCFTQTSLSDWIRGSDRLLAKRSGRERTAILGGNARRIYGIS